MMPEVPKPNLEKCSVGAELGIDVGTDCESLLEYRYYH
jgi:hypothetical protein